MIVLHDYVVLKQEKEQRTATGIIIPGGSKGPLINATVCAFGPEVTDLKIGDNVTFKRDKVYPIAIGDAPNKMGAKDEYFVVKYEDILVVLERAGEIDVKEDSETTSES